MTQASTLDRIQQLVDQGDLDMATIEAIRAVDAWWPEPGEASARTAALGEVLNVLGVLRHMVGDRRGAVGAFRAALDFAPGHADAAANLAEAQVELDAALAVPAPLPPALPDALNPWTEHILAGAADHVTFAGARVLEIGGAMPPAVTRGLGVALWAACEPRATEVHEPGYEMRAADAGALPWADDSFDVVFSSCAFEHFLDVPGVLAEALRVLRPGGRLVSEYGPLWTHAHGHHLYTEVDGVALSFEDPVVPRWGHLLLGRRALRRFLALGYGPAVADHADRFIFDSDETNRLPEAGHRRAFSQSGFVVERLEPRGHRFQPSPATAAELAALHPDGSDFSVFSYQVVLRKPDAVDPRVSAARGTPRPHGGATVSDGSAPDGRLGHDEALEHALVLGRLVEPAEWRRVRFNLLGHDLDTIECTRDGVRWSLAAADHISREVFATGGFQRAQLDAVAAWLRHHRPPGTARLVVDVGANIGTTTVPFAQAGWDVLAVEPGPRMFSLLQRTVEGNALAGRVTLCEAAVGAREGTALLAIEPWNLGGSELVVDGHVSFLSGQTPTEFHEVAVRPLDALVAAVAEPDDVALVWSDVQGSEADVVETGSELWRRGVPLHCELWPAALEGHRGLERFLDGADRAFTRFVDARTLAGGRPAWRPLSELRPLVEALAAGTGEDCYTDVLLLGGC